MKRSDISEETIYIFECPFCHMNNDTYDDPDYQDYYECEHCRKEIELED